MTFKCNTCNKQKDTDIECAYDDLSRPCMLICESCLIERYGGYNDVITIGLLYIGSNSPVMPLLRDIIS